MKQKSGQHNAASNREETTSGRLPTLLFTEDLARLCGLSVSTIRHYTGNAEQFGHLLPKWFKRPGGRRLAWLEKDVIEWLEAGMKAGTRPAPLKPRGRPTKRESLERKKRDSELVEVQ